MNRCSIPGTLLLLLALTVGSPHHALSEEKPVVYPEASPEELYRIVHRARWQVDAATVLACTSRRAHLSEEEVYQALMRERIRLPQELVLRRREVSEGFATLVFEGRRRDREGDAKRIVLSEGIITLVKEDGTWRIRHEKWRDVGYDLPAELNDAVSPPAE